MQKKIKLALLGGDRRQVSLANFLAKQGYGVFSFGLGAFDNTNRVIACDSWQEAVKDADAVLLALPASSDGVRVNCPMVSGSDPPKLSAVFETMDKNAYFIGGRLSPLLKSSLEEKNIKYFDYFDSEELQLRNALPTAEGAISIAMQELEVTLFGARAAVVGYGRIGKLLAKMLLSLGADVTVVARKSTDLVRAEHAGCSGLKIEYKNRVNSMEALSEGYDVIFNTVPYWLFDDALLRTLDKNTLIIDLASAPGGVDNRSAKENGIKVIWALSLPGKYAPVSAGEIIGKTVLEFLRSEEVNL